MTRRGNDMMRRRTGAAMRDDTANRCTRFKCSLRDVGSFNVVLLTFEREEHKGFYMIHYDEHSECVLVHNILRH